NLIHHFRYASEGMPIPTGFSYQSVESPKGELGVAIISSGASRPYRVKLRTPVSHNMHLIPSFCIGITPADSVASLCSLDIVLGEIERKFQCFLMGYSKVFEKKTRFINILRRGRLKRVLYIKFA